MNLRVGTGVKVHPGVEATLSLTHFGSELTLDEGRPWGCYYVNIKLERPGHTAQEFQMDICLCADDDSVIDLPTIVETLNGRNVEQVEAFIETLCNVSVYLRHSGTESKFELVIMTTLEPFGMTAWIGEFIMPIGYATTVMLNDFLEVKVPNGMPTGEEQ